MAIYFYSDREQPYGCFCNFSAHGFVLANLYWPLFNDLWRSIAQLNQTQRHRLLLIDRLSPVTDFW